MPIKASLPVKSFKKQKKAEKRDNDLVGFFIFPFWTSLILNILLFSLYE